MVKRRTPHGSGLGQKRHVVENALAWYHQGRKLEMREEHTGPTFQTLTDLATNLIYEHVLNR